MSFLTQIFKRNTNQFRKKTKFTAHTNMTRYHEETFNFKLFENLDLHVITKNNNMYEFQRNEYIFNTKIIKQQHQKRIQQLQNSDITMFQIFNVLNQTSNANNLINNLKILNDIQNTNDKRYQFVITQLKMMHTAEQSNLKNQLTKTIDKFEETIQNNHQNTNDKISWILSTCLPNLITQINQLIPKDTNLWMADYRKNYQKLIQQPGEQTIAEMMSVGIQKYIYQKLFSTNGYSASIIGDYHTAQSTMESYYAQHATIDTAIIMGWFVNYLENQYPETINQSFDDGFNFVNEKDILTKIIEPIASNINPIRINDNYPTSEIITGLIDNHQLPIYNHNLRSYQFNDDEDEANQNLIIARNYAIDILIKIKIRGEIKYGKTTEPNHS